MDDWLLDDHLGQLMPEERRDLADAMSRDPALAERHRRLQRVLEPLDSYSVPGPPANLADRIIARVSGRMIGPPVLRVPQAPPVPSGSGATAVRRMPLL